MGILSWAHNAIPVVAMGELIKLLVIFTMPVLFYLTCGRLFMPGWSFVPCILIFAGTHARLEHLLIVKTFGWEADIFNYESTVGTSVQKVELSLINSVGVQAGMVFASILATASFA